MTRIQSMEDLAQARQEALERQNALAETQRYHIRVSMGSCGIAVGARTVFENIQRLLDSSTLADINPAEIRLSQTGCIGLCAMEPVIQVQSPDHTQVTYGKVTPGVARRIIEEHIGKGLVVQEHVVEYA